MSNNAEQPPAAGGKRAVLPKHLATLDVALEREKSVKARQKQRIDAAVDAADKSTVSSEKYEVGAGTTLHAQETSATREKSPTKQRNSINKVAVAVGDVQPAKRPASAPVRAAAKGTTVKPMRASVGCAASAVNSSALTRTLQSDVNRSSRDDDAGARAIKVKPLKTAFEHSDGVGNGDDNGSDNEGGGDIDDGDAPAIGHYDIFVQTRKCEGLCRDLGLTLKHIRRMKKKYDDNDMYCTGEITQAEFFFMINEEERPISRGIFKLGGIAPSQKYISFDQYALCVVRFASLTKPELFQYVFDLYDDDQSGSLDEREFTKMSKELQSKQFCFPKNVETAIKMLGGTDGGRGVGTDDGLVDIAQFMKFARNFPVAFYPIVNMQKNIRAATLGESLWSRIVARKLKTQELLSHMRCNYGTIPELTTRERISSFFSDDIFHIRKRAGELYATEVMQRRHIGSTD